MNSKVYRWCGVPQCENTSIKTPDKLFVYVPHNKTIRNKWLKLARRDLKTVLPSTQLYFCEDHFDLPNDMDNYMEYHLMGSVSQIRMKPGCMPTKFECQPDRRKRTSDATERPYILKKQRKTLIEECQKDLEKISTKQVKLEEMSEYDGNSASQASISNISQENAPKTVDKSIQVNMKYKFRSKATQTKPNIVDHMTSPLKPYRQSVSTSPTKTNITAKPSMSNVQKLLKIKEESDSVTSLSYTPSVTQRDSSPSTISLQMKSTSDCSELIEEDKKQVNSKILECTYIVKNE